MQEPDTCLEDVEDIDTSNLLEIEEGKKLLPLTEVHSNSFLDVVNSDLYSGEGTNIRAQQIHVVEMRASVRWIHGMVLAIDLNSKLAWNRVGSK